jgi:uncharacterized protein (TIGR03084 family)
MANISDDRALVLADLKAEGDGLDAIVSRAGVDFALPTPSAGWTIGNQIGHLLWTDRVSILACRDPAGFAREVEAFGANPDRTINDGATVEAAKPRAELLRQWRDSRTDLLFALNELPAGARLPGFGPAMGVGTMASARIMETWAHGVDVTDALGLEVAATPRLRHIAGLGIRTRDFAFAIQGRRSPGSPFRVELRAPDGSVWAWGPTEAADRITGSALHFCLLITQRRHRLDLNLDATAGPADDWMDIAQVFAGPPGAGRQPNVGA